LHTSIDPEGIWTNPDLRVSESSRDVFSTFFFACQIKAAPLSVLKKSFIQESSALETLLTNPG